jgi:hypothetical protein
MRCRSLFFAAFFVLMASPASACLGPMLEHTIFFKQAPADTKADLVAQGTLEEVRNNPPKNANDRVPTATAVVRLTQVFQGKAKAGERVTLQYEVSSCGPNQRVGEKGMIIAKASAAGDFYIPETRAYGNDWPMR